MKYAHVATFNGVHWVWASNYCLWVLKHLKLILGHFGYFNVYFIDCYEQRSPIEIEYLKRCFRLTRLFFKSYVAQLKLYIAWSDLAGV